MARKNCKKLRHIQLPEKRYPVGNALNSNYANWLTVPNYYERDKFFPAIRVTLTAKIS